MTEKDLLIQLNKLKTVNADGGFKEANRKLLLAQIAHGEDLKNLGSLARLNIFMSRLFQPYAVAIMIVLFFVASSVWGWQVSGQSKPGDSLYLAKKLSERTKMLVAVNDKTKTKLNLEFASNRLLEINLLEQGANQPEMSAKEDLKNEFKKEINQAKSRLSKNSVKNNPDQPALSNKSEDFKTAGIDKNNERIDVAVPEKKVASSTINNNDGLGEVLEEAERLFDMGSYKQAVDKLDEANQLVDQAK